MCAKNHPQEQVVGVDVGGTKVAAGMFDAQGKILAQTRASMNCRGSAQTGSLGLSAIESLFAKDAAGARNSLHWNCAPGRSTSHRRDHQSANVPCWRDFPLADESPNTTLLK